MAYAMEGHLEKAELPLERLESLQDPAAYQYATWLRVHLEVLRGNIDKAQTTYEEGQRVAESGTNCSPALPLTLAFAAVALGHIDEAIAWCNRALEAGPTGITMVRAFMATWPTYAEGNGPALIAHPGFQAFLAKMNLDDASIAALEAGEAGE